MEVLMATNLAIDDNLLTLAQKIGGKKTKKDTVNEALAEYVKRRQQEEILNLFGKVDFDEDYDYKELRNRK
jgi:Arc/MetJ family transcription regulator